jgi:anaerobic magnesium-protoporphyrin IX monomethyl ester cyclase
MTANDPKILLVSLTGDTDNIGVKYLHSALLKAGHDSAILFYTSEQHEYDSVIADFIADKGYDAVCISLMSLHYLKAVALSKSIRTICGADTVVVWGGTHPSIDPQSCLPFADYVCYGEGEEAVVQFFEHWKNSGFHDKVTGFNTHKDESLTTCPVA